MQAAFATAGKKWFWRPPNTYYISKHDFYKNQYSHIVQHTRPLVTKIVLLLRPNYPGPAPSIIMKKESGGGGFLDSGIDDDLPL
jgi:hypothetical protein